MAVHRTEDTATNARIVRPKIRGITESRTMSTTTDMVIESVINNLDEETMCDGRRIE